MLNVQVVKLYHELRIPHVGRYSGTGAIYHYQVAVKSALSAAIYHEKVDRLWAEHEDKEVRLRIEPDNDADIDFLAGDSYNPVANPDINPETLKRQEKEFIDRVNRDGVYGIISEVKCPCCGHWEEADSCWGFVGDDWKDSGVDLDVKSAALDKAGFWN